GVGGADSITTLGGRDIILGGADADTINAGDGHNIVLGDTGYIDYVGLDNDPSDIDRIASPVDLADAGIGGGDQITTGAGDDIILGGAAGDGINAGDGDNLVLGDSGQITAAAGSFRTLAGQPLTIGVIATVAPGVGGGDAITTGAGRDIILA